MLKNDSSINTMLNSVLHLSGAIKGRPWGQPAKWNFAWGTWKGVGGGDGGLVGAGEMNRNWIWI